MIELKNVSFSYGEHNVLNDFNLKVKAGECVHLFGASGSGKTTVARLILGLENADKGNIYTPDKISCVFQENRLVETLSVINNIRIPLKKQHFLFADELLKEMNLYSIRKNRISTLSGGEKRRVAIVRAIAYAGDALILDEAFTGIDYENKLIIAKIIKREFLDKDKSVIMITHIPEDAKLLNARIVNIKGDG